MIGLKQIMISLKMTIINHQLRIILIYVHRQLHHHPFHLHLVTVQIMMIVIRLDKFVEPTIFSRTRSKIWWVIGWWISKFANSQIMGIPHCKIYWQWSICYKRDEICIVFNIGCDRSRMAIKTYPYYLMHQLYKYKRKYIVSINWLLSMVKNGYKWG